MRLAIFYAMSILAIIVSATYDISPEAFEGSYKDLGIPTIYDLATTQLGNYHGSWATNSWITGTNGEQYFVTSHYVNIGTDDVFRSSILDLTSLDYHSSFQAGNGSYPLSPAGHLKVGINGNGFEGISEDNYGIMRIQSFHEHIKFNLTYYATSKPLINGGTGVIMFGGSESREWGLPACRTEGFLVVNGEQITVDPARSLTWYDRQWGAGGFTNWTWFGLVTPQTGDMFSIWAGDTQDPASSERFATVRDASGAQTVCSIIWTPDFSHVLDDSATGKTFPLAWTLQIPSYDAIFKIKSVTPNQLNPGSSSFEPPMYIGFVSFSGKVQGTLTQGIGTVGMD